MDMDAAYGNEKNPLIEKSEFILSVFEQLVGAGNLSAKEKSILTAVLQMCTGIISEVVIPEKFRH